MKDNPFVSFEFTAVWLNHFNREKPGINFDFIPNLFFVKHKFLPLFTNVGKNHTKGIYYSPSEQISKDSRSKVFLIYDVPTYFKVNNFPPTKTLEMERIKQYRGYLINLDNFKDLNDYMVFTFGKSSRYKLNKYKKRLEMCFEINYRMFYGPLSKEEYDFVFERFKTLLAKRFLEKQVANNNLDPKEWNFYYEVSYSMISQKKASLFVIYDGTEPIGVTLNFFSEDIMFDAITVFDIDYSKFHLGSTTIMKLIEWGIERNLRIFDFSKGYFPYKQRWMTKEYNFEYHLYHDPSSIWATTISFFLKKYLQLKQFLREKNIDNKYHRLKYLILEKQRKKRIDSVNIKFERLVDKMDKTNLIEVDYKNEKYTFLKKIVFDYLYIHSGTKSEVKVYKLTEPQAGWLISGGNIEQKVILI